MHKSICTFTIALVGPSGCPCTTLLKHETSEERMLKGNLQLAKCYWWQFLKPLVKIFSLHFVSIDGWVTLWCCYVSPFLQIPWHNSRPECKDPSSYAFAHWEKPRRFSLERMKKKICSFRAPMPSVSPMGIYGWICDIILCGSPYRHKGRISRQCNPSQGLINTVNTDFVGVSEVGIQHNNSFVNLSYGLTRSIS